LSPSSPITVQISDWLGKNTCFLIALRSKVNCTLFLVLLFIIGVNLFKESYLSISVADRRITVLYDKAALVINSQNKNFICVADLHLGYTPSSSILLHSRQLAVKLADEIVEQSRKAKAENLILLGDIKHTIARVSYSDRSLIDSFFATLRLFFKEVYLVLGNHDGSISRILPTYVKEVKRGLLLDRTYLMHGHALPGLEALKSNLIVMGHLHPLFYKEHSPLNGQRVWILMTLRLNGVFPGKHTIFRLIVMPSFNSEISFPLSLAYSPNFSSKISPLLNRCKEDVLETKIISLDGTILAQI
jgi:metallophosphoesterase superfamily enzyme